MVETPAAVQIIEDICKENINFISFGTNDLTQFTLAIDRGNEDVQYIYNEMNPAVLAEIKKVISVCRRYNVKTSICGQAGSKKEMIEFLFEQGIDSISVNADAAHQASILIRGLEDDSGRFDKKIFEKSDEKEEDKNEEKGDEEGKYEENINNMKYKEDEIKQVAESRGFQKYQRPEGSENWSKSKWKRWKKKNRQMSDPSKVPAWHRNPGSSLSKDENHHGLFSDKRAETLVMDSLENIKNKAEKIHKEVEKENELEAEREKEFEDNIKVEEAEFGKEDKEENSEVQDKVQEEYEGNQDDYGSVNDNETLDENQESKVIEADFKEKPSSSSLEEENSRIADEDENSKFAANADDIDKDAPISELLESDDDNDSEDERKTKKNYYENYNEDW